LEDDASAADAQLLARHVEQLSLVARQTLDYLRSARFRQSDSSAA
jgi:hypothetical protein